MNLLASRTYKDSDNSCIIPTVGRFAGHGQDAESRLRRGSLARVTFQALGGLSFPVDNGKQSENNATNTHIPCQELELSTTRLNSYRDILIGRAC